MRLKILIILGILISINLVSASDFYYHAWMKYDRGDVSIVSVDMELLRGEIENFVNEDEFASYKTRITDNNGNVLYEEVISAPNKQWYDIYDEKEEEIIDGGVIEVNETEFDIFIPYYENAKEIIIYDLNGNEITKKFLSQYSKTGYDREDFKGEKTTDGEGVDVDKETDEDRVKAGDGEEKGISKFFDNNLNYVLLILILILVVLILIFVYPRKRKRKYKR